MTRKLFIISSLLILATLSWGAGCPAVPLPTVDAQTVQVCHDAYVSLYDVKAHVPRVVVYELTRRHTLGCLARAANFHGEPGTAKPAEYNGTGYDLGHMMSAEDASWSAEIEHDSFSMVNVVPQLPGLNRQEWERLEEAVRAWAWARKDVLVYVGPILSDIPKTIGNDIAVPEAFFKIVVDTSTGEAIAFILPQKAEPKGSVWVWESSYVEVARQTGITFPRGWKATHPWDLDLTGWRAAHRAQCKESQ
jgi:endonuclease G